MLPVDRTIELEASFGTMTDGTNRAMFNQISYQSPLVPTVLSVLTLGSNATEATAYGTASIVLDHLSAVQIILKNGDVGKHPLYVHSSCLFQCFVVPMTVRILAIFTVTRCKLSIEQRTIHLATQRLTHPSWKVRQIRCVVTLSRSEAEPLLHCVWSPTILALGCCIVCTHLSHPVQVLTDMPYRPYRMAPGGGPRSDLH
jgi:hypothetical protein